VIKKRSAIAGKAATKKKKDLLYKTQQKKRK